MPTVLIPMAGQGSRFKSNGYDTPKPLIEVAGQTLAERSIKTLGLPNAHYVFITRSFDKPEDNEKLTEIFTNNCKTFTEVRIDSLHLGAAHSALYAKKYIDSDDELIVTNCDQSLLWDAEKFLKTMHEAEADASVVIFKSNDPKHSYLEIKDGHLAGIVEKRPVSDNALIGVHYWKNAKDFFESAEKLMNDYKDLGYKEPYVSTTFNYLLESRKILPYWLSKKERYHSLGTPEDVDKFLNITDRKMLDSEMIQHYAEYEDVVGVSDNCKYSIIKNVAIYGPEGDREITLDKAFLFNAQESSFYHGIADVVGQYLALKNMVGEDLVPLYVQPHEQLTVANSANFMQEIIYSGIINLKVADNKINKINIKNLYVISPRDFVLFYKLFMNIIPEILTEESNPGNTAYVAKLLRPVSEAIINYLGDVPENNKKIFLHSSNKWVGVDSSVVGDHDRFVSKEQYDEVVKEYEDLGYEIIDPEHLTFFEQATLVRASSAIATLKSSNSIHSIYARPGADFTMINLSKSNSFPHEVVVNHFIDNPIIIDRSKDEDL